MKRKFMGMLLIFVCCCCLLLAGCNEKPNEYQISVLINGAKFGTVEDISGTYIEGASVTVKARPASDSEKFFAWIHDNQIVSTDAEYSFKINHETSGTYIALFNCPDLEYYFVDNFTITNNIPALNGEAEQNIKEILIEFGYNTSEVFEVFKFDFESMPEINGANIDFTNDFLYTENYKLFAFDKTRDVFVKVRLTFAKGTEDIMVDYISETIYVISAKEIGTEEQNKVENIENKQLELTKSTINESVLESKNENLEYIKNTFTMNFKSLMEFPFEVEEEPEE